MQLLPMSPDSIFAPKEFVFVATNLRIQMDKVPW